MIVHGIVCRQCKTAVYSRARHDMRWCKCGNCAIDGGQSDYYQITGKPDTYDLIPIEVNATEKELYDDWNTGADKFGLIKPKED